LNTYSLAHPRWFTLAGIAASALLLGLYARGGHAWPLGFIALVPWLLALNQTRTLIGALASGWLTSVGFVLAVFAWFGTAVGAFTGSGTPMALLVAVLLAPLLQPQVLAFALARHLAGARHGPLLRALAGACAWVACEWLWPKLLGDTLGHGLAPAQSLRQIADLGGAAGITLLLILVNEALTLALTRWRAGARALLPLTLAAVVPALMAGYGQLRLSTLQLEADAATPHLRIGLLQSAIVDYEGQRREIGAYAVVRKVLDTHFALSRAAIEHHGVDALLWSETVYPTTFGNPRSEDGAALDQEILDFVTATGVPLVFGSYDLDAAGEYNAAAFVEPGAGLLGFYRKTHPFPLTEYVPAWLDSPLIRGWLPWMGSWQPGSGARTFPLRAADGRELQVLPLICLDDVRPQLAIDGARLGAQAIIGLSNDAWFSADPQGARLHLAVATFRSIETRLPQLRVTTNGLSAYVDVTGQVVVSTAMGDQAVLAGELPVRDPPRTLMVRWGDWVGGAALGFLLLIAVAGSGRAWRHRPGRGAIAAAPQAATPFAADVVVLTRPWRIATALLRLAAAGGLLALLLLMLLRDGLQVNSLAQIRLYGWGVLLPLIAAWAIQRLFAASARVESGLLVLRQRTQRIEIPVASIALIHVWRLPLPGVGVDLQLASGRRWGIRLTDPQALLGALSAAGGVLRMDAHSRRIADFAAARAAATRPWLDHPLAKFALFPLVPALPAFRLHQHIAFGGTFGEYYTYGLNAWLIGLLIWWAAWSIGLMLFAAVLRIGAETCALLAQQWRPTQQVDIRRRLEWLGRLLFYFGVPAWLLLRIVVG
jgi:apolipoprotein N-acyltransferase